MLKPLYYKHFPYDVMHIRNVRNWHYAYEYDDDFRCKNYDTNFIISRKDLQQSSISYEQLFRDRKAIFVVLIYCYNMNRLKKQNSSGIFTGYMPL